MQINITIDTSTAQALARKFPYAAEVAARNFVERVGFTIEGAAKDAAPAITGNLRRSIFFIPDSPLGGSRVHAYANYAKYVHGDPYFSPASPRKITPFFTRAMFTSQSQIAMHRRAIIKDIANGIGK